MVEDTRSIEHSDRRGWPYSNLEIDHLFHERAHLIVETEPVFPLLFGGEDKVALTFFLSIQYNLVVGAYDIVVHIEGTA